MPADARDPGASGVPLLGVVLRNMGDASQPGVVGECARAAEQSGLESLWVTDHVAIPPDDAEGSGGRYLDPLATLAFLAGTTSRIRLGTGVLVLPYRPPLPTAKWVATIQELSGGRLLLGVGAGWMHPEFRALGIERSRRGADTDAVLGFLRKAFESDVVEAHGQEFLFRPRPERPPIYVGGAPPHALERTVRFGDGWFPIGLSDGRLGRAAEELRERAAAAGRAPPEIVTFASLPWSDPPRAAERLRALGALGVTRVVHGERYAEAGGFRRMLEGLARAAEA